MNIFRLWRNLVQSSKTISIKLMRSCAHEGTQCLYIEGEKWLSSQCGKSEKNTLTITSKSHAHPHTMKKTHAKFHNNRYKTVRGVALKRDTNCLYIKGEKLLSSQCGKVTKMSNNYIQITYTSSYHEKNICKVSKRSVENCKRSCAHKSTHCLYIEGEKWLSSQCGKKWQKCSNNYT